jgi:CarboxypepD_reg-like domain
MAKPVPIQIIIPEPCTENWHRMERQDRDRLCARCNNTVVDFTGYNNHQLYNFFSQEQNANVCGRYRIEQLNKNILPEKEARNSVGKYAMAAGLALLLFTAGYSSFAQPPLKPVTTTSPIGMDTTHNDNLTLSGIIIDENKEPVIGAVVLVVKNNISRSGASSDVDGRFQITPLEKGRCHIVVSYIGYKKITSAEFLLNADTTLPAIQLEIDTNLKLEDVRVIGFKVPLLDPYRQ